MHNSSSLALVSVTKTRMAISRKRTMLLEMRRAPRLIVQRPSRDDSEITQRSQRDQPEITDTDRSPRAHSKRTRRENTENTQRGYAENTQRTFASLAEHTHISRRATAILLMQCNGSNSWMALSLGEKEGGRGGRF